MGIEKYRVHEVAKDFGLPTKTITEILTTLGGVLCYRQFLQQETARSHPSD